MQSHAELRSGAPGGVTGALGREEGGAQQLRLLRDRGRKGAGRRMRGRTGRRWDEGRVSR